MMPAGFTPPAKISGYPSDTPMLLALSGGADSALLLHLCAEHAKQAGARIHLAHVNHGIRGEEADRDEQFCRTLAAHYGLPLHVLHADIPAEVKDSGESVEQAARRVRYGYFAALMREHSIPMLLTAHHADDNLETLLLRLVRGTGLSGLGGIAPVRPFVQVGEAIGALAPVVVRPLLTLSRRDVLAACAALGLTYVTDSTNADVHYARNRLRRDVLPVLREMVDHPEQQVLHTCEVLREDEAFLLSLAHDFLNASDHRQGNALVRKALAVAPLPIAKRALRLWIDELTGHTPEACHVQAVLALCLDGGTSHSVSIEGGYTVTADKTLLHVVEPSVKDDLTEPFELEIDPDASELTAGGWHVCIERSNAHTGVTASSNDATNVYNPFIRDTLSFDIIIPYDAARPLVLRSRREGDVLLLRGKHRKLRKLQNERGIPPALRERLPLLCDGDGILWAPMVGHRDGTDTAPDGYLHLTITSI